jgi:UDP-3-O-[3-hydroxymyristoyl] glucosamine N-acyltransferase
MLYKKIVQITGAECYHSDYVIEEVMSIDECSGRDKSTLTWVSDKRIEQLEFNIFCTVICSHSASGNKYLRDANLIIVENPRDAFRKVLEFFSETKSIVKASGVAATASVHSSATLGSDISIGHNVVIEAGVRIADRVSIGHGTVLMRETVIGTDVKIGSNCTIGGVGFGYEKDDTGEYIFLHHLGNVVIEDKVEIGNNTCIDRAVLGSTIIRQSAKVDNLVHISHGCDIGSNSLIIANAMIGGSVKVGENSWIAPSASIINKASIGDDATVGLAAVVLKNVAANEVVVGNPARPLVRK